jgi:hypothetical protein
MKQQIVYALAAALLVQPTWAQTQTVVSPTSTSGPTRLYGPIQREARMQQVYGSGDFGAVGSGAYVTEIAFQYAFELFGARGGTASNVLITMSTTQKQPDALSRTFAENIGADERVVYGTAPVVLPPGDRTGFDVFIKLTNPFFYNPTSGNLLLDIRNFGGISDPGMWAFDAQEVVGDSVSRLWANDPNASVEDFVDSVGLVTRFTFEPIPEPSTAALLVLGGLYFGLRLRRCTNRKGKNHGPAGRTIT